MVERQSDGESWQPNGKIMRGQVEGKRPRGRPRKRWSDDF